MGFKVSVGGAVYFTKLSVRLACTWPLPPNSTKWENTKFDILWTLSLLNAFACLASMLYSMYKFPSDSLLITKITCAGSISQFIIKIVLCRLQKKRIQHLIYEMENFLKEVQPHEQAVLQRYVDRCSSFHITITLLNYLTPVVVFCGTFFKPDETLPVPAAYPFSVDSGLMLYLAYIHQFLSASQCSAGTSVDCQTGMLMWYVSARLEILAADLEKITNCRMLRELIKKHQQLLGFAYEAKNTMSYVALATIIAGGVATICSCIQLVSDEPMIVKMQFGPWAVIAIAGLFICAWPGDNIIAACDSVGEAAYNCTWVDMPPKFRGHILMILRRSQRPEVASIGGFVPALSLRYYASFLSTVFSYFTTLNATMSTNKE